MEYIDDLLHLLRSAVYNQSTVTGIVPTSLYKMSKLTFHFKSNEWNSILHSVSKQAPLHLERRLIA